MRSYRPHRRRDIGSPRQRLTLRMLRGLVALGLALLIGVSVVLIGASILLPATGHQLLIISSGSMAPNIPVGSLVLIGPPPGTSVAAGDVVTFRLPNGGLVTHRVVRTFSLANEPYLSTKGDANRDPDLVAIPARSVVGKALAWAPEAGYFVAFVQGPLGRLVFICLLLIFLSLHWFWEDLFDPISDEVTGEIVLARVR